MAEAWEESLDYWDSPGEGDVSLEVWSHFNGATDLPMGFMVVPIRGDWAGAVDNGEIERALLEGAGVKAEAYAVNVFENGQWNRRVLWSRKSGVEWLS